MHFLNPGTKVICKITSSLPQFLPFFFANPMLIYFANSHHAKDLKRIIDQELKSELRFRPPGAPNFSGNIERFFRTLDTKLIHNLPGTTFSQPSQQGDKNPDDEACLTLSELRKIIHRFVVDIYHFEEHDGLPLNCPLPYAYYQKGIDDHGLPRVVPICEKENLWLRFLPETTRNIGREGIQLDNRFYASDFTKAFVGFKEQRVRRDPYNIAHIFLLHPVDKKWIEVPSVKPPSYETDGVTEYEWNYYRKLDKQIGDQVVAQTPQVSRIPYNWARIEKEVDYSKQKTKESRRSTAIVQTTSKKNIVRPKNVEKMKKLDALERLKKIQQVPSKDEELIKTTKQKSELFSEYHSLDIYKVSGKSKSQRGNLWKK